MVDARGLVGVGGLSVTCALIVGVPLAPASSVPSSLPSSELHVVPNEHRIWISIPLRRRSVMELVIRRVGL